MIQNLRRFIFASLLLVPVALIGCSQDEAYIPAPGDNPPAPPAENESQGTTQSGSLQGEVK